MNIRPFEQADMAQLIQLYRKCFAEPPWFEEFDPLELEQDFLEICSWPDGVVMVAESESNLLGASIGFGISRKPEVLEWIPASHQNAFYLADLFVDKDARQKGIAKNLIDARLAAAKTLGFSEGVVRTSVNQPIVQHIYLGKFGYVIHATLDTISTKVIDGEKREVPDPRILMIGYL